MSPVIAGRLLVDKDHAAFNAPFIISGALKIAYDLLLYASFRASSGRAHSIAYLLC